MTGFVAVRLKHLCQNNRYDKEKQNEKESSNKKQNKYISTTSNKNHLTKWYRLFSNELDAYWTVSIATKVTWNYVFLFNIQYSTISCKYYSCLKRMRNYDLTFFLRTVLSHCLNVIVSVTNSTLFYVMLNTVV